MLDKLFAQHRIDHFHNPAADQKRSYPEECKRIFDADICCQAIEEIHEWPAYRQTPLVNLEGLARELEVGAIYYKDEGGRFGLGSFKSLGGAYEVLCLLQREVSRQLGTRVSLRSLREGKYADQARNITVVTATDGNHGRSVAWGAQLFGCHCIIYLHANVSEGRRQAIEALGAQVAQIDGNYDASVQQAAEDAAANGWFIVSDTSYEGYTDLPRHVMAGYTVMVDEILKQLPKDLRLSHSFIQGGVGGLAGAVCGYLWQQLGSDRPRFVIVEPDRADCLFQSARNGRPKDVDITTETIMAGLSCGRVSALAWQILSRCGDDFLTIPDDLIEPAMRLLAGGPFAPTPVVAGESAVAGLAALIVAARDPVLRGALGLDGQSRVLLFGTEGATDPVIYEEMVGRPADDVRTAGPAAPRERNQAG